MIGELMGFQARLRSVLSDHSCCQETVPPPLTLHEEICFFLGIWSCIKESALTLGYIPRVHFFFKFHLTFYFIMSFLRQVLNGALNSLGLAM